MVAETGIHPAQAYRSGGEPVRPLPDGSLVLEAEEFRVLTPGWQARNWGENYYAATIANTFLSRKAFLGAPVTGETSKASIQLQIEEGGDYLVLARYEAAFRFETQFMIRIEQGGQTVFERMYGARDNIKIWPFRRGLQTEIAWRWGAVENIVWEGWLGDDETPFASLKPGRATLYLIAPPQTGDAAKRNVDLIMLTQDVDRIKARLDNQRLRFNPLDGLLTQAADVWIQVTPRGNEPVTVTAPARGRARGFHEHSPYWVHQREWQAASVTVSPGETSDWTDVGGVMDTLNDGQWTLTASGPCTITFGVAAADGSITPIKTVDRDRSGNFMLAADADTRYSKRLRFIEEVLEDLLVDLRPLAGIGVAPSLTPIYATIFGQHITIDETPEYHAKRQEFLDLFGIIPREGDFSTPGAYIDWRRLNNQQLEGTCSALPENERRNIRVVSLGDEISLPQPRGESATEGFATFLKERGLTPQRVDANAKEWSDIVYNNSDDIRESHPGVFYWSHRYRHQFGIDQIKVRTDIIRRFLPNAGVGANFSPHHGGYAHAYLNEVFQWIDCFRQSGMTMPWSEDYIWQVPVGTPQMNAINLAMFRAANRPYPERDIHYYVMAHYPGNTPAMWRRLFFNALGHGMTMLNLYQFTPLHSSYTENYVESHAMYQAVLRTVREFGTYEDLVQSGRLRPARTGLWFSETADIWNSNAGSAAAAKRAMFIAIIHQGVPVDVIVDDDAMDNTLDDYDVLYLTDSHVRQDASERLAEWVKQGGQLFVTAGAGMWNEYNRPNTVLRELFGIEASERIAPEDVQLAYIKQDLPFAEPLDTVSMTMSDDETESVSLPAFGIVSRITPASDTTVIATFSDQRPAMIERRHGKGEVLYCAFLPSLSYFHPAIPRRPVDRGSTDDAMSHFIPTEFDANAANLIAKPLADIERPVSVSHPLIEASVIESDKGLLVVLGNWTGAAVEGLALSLNLPYSGNSHTLGSGGNVSVEDRDGTTTFVFDLEISGDTLVLR